MTFSELSFWAIHIYQSGNYHRTMPTPFTRETADVFCKVFNGGDGKVRAIAAEVRCRLEVAARI